MRRDDHIAALNDIDILEEPVEVNEYKYQHGKRKYFCKECSGKGICEHGFKTVKEHVYASTTFAENTVRNVEALSCVVIENTKRIVNIVQDHRYVNTEDKSIRVESVNQRSE